MYVMNRKLWIATYIAVWAMVMAVFTGGSPMWLCILVSALALGFVGFTDPAPSRATVLRTTFSCDCARCVSMRSRHTRRRTDVKDTD